MIIAMKYNASIKILFLREFHDIKLRNNRSKNKGAIETVFTMAQNLSLKV